MKTLSINECQQDLAALDAADKLTASVTGEFNKLRNLGMSDLLKKAGPMLMTGNVSLAALGLPENFFEQLEQLTKINDVARRKYRACVQSDLNQLNEIEEAQTVVINGGEHE